MPLSPKCFSHKRHNLVCLFSVFRVCLVVGSLAVQLI
jgi:hypothetical protein